MKKFAQKKALEVLLKDLNIQLDQLVISVEKDLNNEQQFDVDFSENANENIDPEFKEMIKQKNALIAENLHISSQNIDSLSETISFYEDKYSELLKTF